MSIIIYNQQQILHKWPISVFYMVHTHSKMYLESPFTTFDQLSTHTKVVNNINFKKIIYYCHIKYQFAFQK